VSHNRRRFLGTVGTAAVAGSLLPRDAQAASASENHPPPISNRYDVSWADRITGRFRAVFDSPNAADGAALVRATAWCDQYKEIYGVGREQMSPVLVIRAGAIELVMKDSYWARFPVGEELKLKGADGEWLRVNPISAESRAAAEPTQRRYTLETFMAEGGIVLACSWAFSAAVQRYRAADSLSGTDAAARARENLIPGVLLQPNGIFAVLRAQEAGCHFVAAS
jgi:hypothetical protein